MTWLAEIAGDLTPAMFAAEVWKLSQPAKLIAVHIKPRFAAEVMSELEALGLADFEIGRFDQPYVF
jgi:hypothetical protein